MATIDELLLAAAAADNYFNTLVIDNDLRTITIPPGVKHLGVEGDDGVTWLHFRMPSMYGDIDLSAFNIRINYMNANGEGDVAVAKNVNVADGVITFSWKIERKAAAYKGNVHFIVCLKNMDLSSVVTEEFNTTVATLPVLEGLETTEQVVQENPDVIEAILARLDKLEAGGPGNSDGTAHPVKYVESPKDNKICIRDLETGQYVLYGYFKPFPDSNSTLIIDNMLLHLYKADAGTYMTSLSADGEVTIYEILVDETNAAGYTYTRKKITLNETVTEITGEEKDNQLATAKAVYNLVNTVHNAGDFHVTRIESTEENGIRNLRELDSGIYILYGYFNAYPGAPDYMPFDNRLVTVEKQTAGSHLFVFQTLNAKVDFHEILVDESTADGFTHTRAEIDLLAMHNNFTGSHVRVANVELLAANWQGNASPYSQVVTIEGVTEYSQVDLKPSVEQLAIFHDKDLAFVSENEDGVVTVYAIGEKPANDYTMQVSITEVIV